MSKTKPTKAAAVKPSKKDSKKSELASVKEGRITKPTQTPKAKSKEIAKSVVAKSTREDKKAKKSKKAPTPEPESESDSSAASESEADSDSDSSASSDEEMEIEAPVKASKPAAQADVTDSSSDSSDSSDADSESEEEAAPKANGVKANGVTKAASDSDASSDDSSDDSASDSDEESEAEKPAAKKAVVNAETSDDTSDDSSDADSASGSSDSSDSEEETKAPSKKRKAETDAVSDVKKVKTEIKAETTGEDGIANLFVGNLSWNVDEEWLQREFSTYGDIESVRIVTDRDSGRSKGFGYVTFVNAADAKKAQGEMNGQDLDNRALNVDFAAPRQNNQDRTNNRAQKFGDQRSAESNTLFIGNVSFDATNDMISEAFAEYGNISRVSLPTDRESGQMKGFGYVDFSTVEEAKAALEALNGAEIAGRAIRLDFAGARPPRDNNFGGGRGGGGGRGRGGGRGGFGDRGGRGGRGGGRGGRGGSTNRGGFGDFSGKKVTF